MVFVTENIELDFEKALEMGATEVEPAFGKTTS